MSPKPPAFPQAIHRFQDCAGENMGCKNTRLERDCARARSLPYDEMLERLLPVSADVRAWTASYTDPCSPICFVIFCTA